MRRTLNAIVLSLFTFALLLLVISAARPHGDALTSTLEMVARPETALQIEAQRQAHALQMAEVAAREADAQAEQSTLRLALILGALVVMCMAGAALYFAMRRSGQITIMLEAHDAEMLEAQWRIVDAQMARKGYELEDTHTMRPNRTGSP